MSKFEWFLEEEKEKVIAVDLESEIDEHDFGGGSFEKEIKPPKGKVYILTGISADFRTGTSDHGRFSLGVNEPERTGKGGILLFEFFNDFTLYNSHFGDGIDYLDQNIEFNRPVLKGEAVLDGVDRLSKNIVIDENNPLVLRLTAVDEGSFSRNRLQFYFWER